MRHIILGGFLVTFCLSALSQKDLAEKLLNQAYDTIHKYQDHHSDYNTLSDDKYRIALSLVDSSLLIDSMSINALDKKIEILLHLKEYQKVLPTINFTLKICSNDNYNIKKQLYMQRAHTIYRLYGDLDKYYMDMDSALYLCENKLKIDNDNMILVSDKVIILCQRNKKEDAKLYLNSLKRKIDKGWYNSLNDYINKFEFDKIGKK